MHRVDGVGVPACPLHGADQEPQKQSGGSTSHQCHLPAPPLVLSSFCRDAEDVRDAPLSGTGRPRGSWAAAWVWLSLDQNRKWTERETLAVKQQRRPLRNPLRENAPGLCDAPAASPA